MSVTGKVKWYNGTKGFGFIAREDNEKDVFVHRTALQAAGLRDLKEGEQVTFDVDIAAKGPCAVNLANPDLNS